MGQQHQAFVIAHIRAYKENQPKYRCVAAFHHQWCYGRLPLRATRRFLTLIKQEENATIIRAEIQAVQGKFGRFDQKPDLPNTPCPYTAFLLGVSWNIDLENPKEPYVSGGDVLDCLLPAGMGSGDGVEEDVQEKIAQLDGETLVEISMLAEAWPTEYRASHEATIASDSNSNPSLEYLAYTNMSSLADLVVEPAIKYALESGNTAQIENLLWIPWKMQRIRSVLLQQSLFSDGGFALLTRVLSLDPNKNHVDLSSSALSRGQIARLVLTLPETEVLDLSYNVHVTIDTVHTILNLAPCLKRLVLLGRLSVSSEDIENLITNEPQLCYGIEALIHPALFNAGATSLPRAFSYIGCEDTGYGRIKRQKLSLPFFTPSTVIQALYDLFNIHALNEDKWNSVTDNLGVLQAAFSAAPRSIGKRWGERSAAIIPQSLSMLDGLRWTFAVKMGDPRKGSLFGFLKFLPLPGETNAGKPPSTVEEKLSDATEVSLSPCEIHDLPSFLTQMVSEGRPAPPEELVIAFAEVIKKMEIVKKMRLMTQDNVGSFIALAKSSKSYSY